MRKTVEEILAERENERVAEAAKKAALSGGFWGGGLGAVAKILGGARSLPKILGGAAVGGGLSALGAGGGTYVGGHLLGAPDEEDSAGFTTRGGVGGALLGGLGGAALGAGLGGGLGRVLGKMPFSKKLAAELPVDNLIGDYIKKWGASPGMQSAKKSAALLGGVGGAVGGHMGMDEGMAIDAYNNAIRDEKRRRMMEAYGDGDF